MNSVLKTSSFDISSGNSHTWCRGKRNIQRTDKETNQALREAGKELQQAHGDHRKGGWLLIALPPPPPVVKGPHYLFVSKQSVYTLNLYVCVSDFIVVSMCETKNHVLLLRWTLEVFALKDLVFNALMKNFIWEKNALEGD